MNSDFPRIITLLRKERNISQKKAASELGVSQALLSHYEKGIRECGLEFLVKVSSYYDVSCDYLLGRSPDPSGNTLSFKDIPENDDNQKEIHHKGNLMVAFNKKLIINSINVIYSLAQKTNSNSLIKHMSAYLMLALYRMFRIVFEANPKNDQNFFIIPNTIAKNGATSAMELAEGMAYSAAKGVHIGTNDCADQEQSPAITANSLNQEFPSQSSSMLNIIKNSEARIQIVCNSEK